MLAIDVKNISKTYKVGFWGKKVKVLNDLSFQVKEGEVFAYLGPNGAGKTTTLKIILGLISADSGTTSILGRSMNDVAIKNQIGYLPENPYFYDYLTGEELLNFFAQFFNLDKTERKQRIDMLFDMVYLENARKLALHKYSKGMLQRIGIAQALINNPKIVFLDEPLSGLDPIGRRHIRDIIFRLKDEGKTILFSSHILSDAEMICDHVTIINKGKVITTGKLEDILKSSTKGLEVTFTNVPENDLTNIKNNSINYIKQNKNILITLPYDDKINQSLLELTQLIEKNNGQLVNITPCRESLENIFMQKVQAA
ncbi:MAG: ABC transporter ATP-binding protein [bacterium]